MNKSSYGRKRSSGYGRSYGGASSKRALTTGSSSYGGKDDHVSGHDYDSYGFSYRKAIPSRYARRSYGGVGLDHYGGYGDANGHFSRTGYGSSGSVGGYGSYDGYGGYGGRSNSYSYRS